MKTSESIKELAAALCKFQAAVKDPAKDQNNPFFKSKYVALDGLLAAVRKPLADNGLSFLQMPSSSDGQVSVTTLLMHTSGEWIEFDPFTLPVAKRDAQGVGSAVTYARRYSLSSILGVAWDDDDDGNSCSNHAGKSRQNGNQAQNRASQPPRQQSTQQPKQQKEPQSVKEYYDLTVEYARQHNAAMFILAILKEKFHKSKFDELTLVEAKAMYANLPQLIAEQQRKDDDKLMDGVG